MSREERIDKIQQAAEALRERLEKFNSCHAKSSGQFCSGGGKGKGGLATNKFNSLHQATQSAWGDYQKAKSSFGNSDPRTSAAFDAYKKARKKRDRYLDRTEGKVGHGAEGKE